jgi:hypothetical protein
MRSIPSFLKTVSVIPVKKVSGIYTITDGGEGFTGHHSEATKKLLAKIKPKKPVRASDGTEYESIRQAARITKIDPGHIIKCCKKIRKHAGGYSWEYIIKDNNTKEI